MDDRIMFAEIKPELVDIHLYTHIVLGKEAYSGTKDQGFYTRCGGYMPETNKWAEFSGHYRMSFEQAVKDIRSRLKRGY
jgi:hypothetical protein|tara:strand:+ start:144 stop:380 length:237 start_codon:yes stop_codon:yes gene_type:complete